MVLALDGLRDELTALHAQELLRLKVWHTSLLIYTQCVLRVCVWLCIFVFVFGYVSVCLCVCVCGVCGVCFWFCVCMCLCLVMFVCMYVCLL